MTDATAGRTSPRWAKALAVLGAVLLVAGVGLVSGGRLDVTDGTGDALQRRLIYTAGTVYGLGLGALVAGVILVAVALAWAYRGRAGAGSAGDD